MASAQPDGLIATANAYFATVVNAVEKILFFPIPTPFTTEGIPFLVFWLLIGGVFFTFRFAFLNYRFIPHGLAVIAGKYKHEEGEGEISSFQAVATVVSGTVGVGGNIAGVAIAVSVGGPGSVVWMMLAGLFCTANKMVEVIAGHAYRQKDAQGHFSGGAWYYLKHGMADLGYRRLGVVLAVMFAVCCVAGALGGGNMFQSNQAVAIMVETFPALDSLRWVIALSMAVLVGVVLIGGITRIAHVTEFLVPFMAGIYLLAGLYIIAVNSDQFTHAVSVMVHHAFTPEAAGGGMMGALLMGLRRAFFSNEAGVGSAPIAHAASRNVHPVREGAVACIEPIIDSVLICGMTGVILVITGAYQGVDGMSGVALTNTAFASVIPWFPYVLSLCVLLFAFSTALTWSYYGERAWLYLTGGRWHKAYYLIFCGLTFWGGVGQLGPIVNLSDLALLSMAVPNLIGLYFLTGKISAMIKDYRESLKASA
jgi:AGCS family alanine or glycine:cation symporter